MISAVLDTNVFISAIVYDGLPGQLLLFADEGEFELYCSHEIVTELRSVLRVKFHYDSSMLDRADRLVTTSSTLVDPKKRIRKIQKDPSDNRILECAVESNADYIVSGDKHLLEVNTFQSIRIVSPTQFMNIIMQEKN